MCLPLKVSRCPLCVMTGKSSFSGPDQIRPWASGSPLPPVLNISVRSRGAGVWLWRRQQVSTFYQPCRVRGQHAALLSHDVALWRHHAALRGHRATPPLEPIMPPSAAKSLPPRTCCSLLETSCCPPKSSFRPQQQQRPAQYRCPSFPWSDRRLRDEPMMLERCALWSRENVRRYNWHRRRPRRSTREGGSAKLETRWRRRHKVWRWGRLCHRRPLVVAFPAFLQISRRGHEKREPAGVVLSSAECSYPQLASKCWFQPHRSGKAGPLGRNWKRKAFVPPMK